MSKQRKKGEKVEGIRDPALGGANELPPSIVYDIIPEKVYCTCVGHIMKPSGQDWVDKVKSSKIVNGQLLLTFESRNFTCDNRTCRLIE